MILAIDSSIGTVVGVVGDQGNCLARAEVEDRRSHAEAIGPLIARAIADATATPADITAVVMGVGPGPFTGLRVGMAAASAFALGRGIPLWPVLSHDAAAWNLERESVVVSDARRGELAVTRYRVEPGRHFGVAVGETRLVAKAGFPGPSADFEGATVIEIDTIDPCLLARAALWYRHNDQPLRPAAAVYLRAPDVTLSQ